MIGERNGVWRVLAVALIGVVVTGVISWLGFAKDTPGRTEVAAMIDRGACQEPEVKQIVAETSPYIQDRAVIRKSINNLESKVVELDGSVDGLRMEQTKLVERIDRVLERLPPPR